MAGVTVITVKAQIQSNVRQSVIVACLFSLLMLAGSLSQASAQLLTIDEMVHTSWTARDGAPQALRSMALGKDGTLWVAGQSGLHNFDGKIFTEFRPAPGQPQLPSTNILSLCVGPDGSVWASMHGAGIARILNGSVTLFTHADKQELSYVMPLRRAPDGTIWGVNRRHNLIRFENSDAAWHVVDSPKTNAPVGSSMKGLLFSASGALWISQNSQLFKRSAGTTTFSHVDVPLGEFHAMTEAHDGTFWLVDEDDSPKHAGSRVQHLDKDGKLLGSLWTGGQPIRTSVIGPDGSLWMGTNDSGVLRLLEPDAGPERLKREKDQLDRYTQTEGLSSNHVFDMLVDTAGNVWTVGDRGLDRFRSSILLPFRPRDQGSAWSVCADRSGSTWVGTATAGLYRVAQGREEHVLQRSSNDVYSLTCSAHGSVWAVDTADIWKMDGARANTVPRIPNARPNQIDQVAEASNGDLYVNLAQGDMWLYSVGRWTALEYSSAPGALKPLTIYMDPEDRLWAGLNHGKLALWKNSAWNPMPTIGLPIGAIWAVNESSMGIVAAGINGVAVLVNGQLQSLCFLRPDDAKGLTGVAEGGNGDLWLNGVHGVLHISATEFHRAIENPAYLMRSEVINDGEFVGPAPLARYSPSVAKSADGEMWFVMDSHVVSLNPAHFLHSEEMPKLSIGQISVDGMLLEASRKAQPLPQSLAISYFGVNLTAPEKVTYRYRLTGVDHGWQEAGHRTEAIYTHLRPGEYHFQVEASNGDEIWTAPLEALPFTVLPSFYQTWWFMVACTTAALLLCWLFISMRVRYLTNLIRVRADERADERVRIARDLHDTLLQGVQGLSLSFHVAALNADSDLREKLDKALVKADRIISEGRDRVTRLRCEELTDAQLIEQFETVGEGLKLDTTVDFQVRCITGVQQLKSHLIDELFNIGREAISNAFLHSGASQIIVTLIYAKSEFEITCKDNGVGFTEERGAAASKSGHWGLKGMAERAKTIGGHFSCVSSPAAGTEISIRVPSALAYRSRRAKFWHLTSASKT
jgi:ligand-binding sensor domain-containing protein